MGDNSTIEMEQFLLRYRQSILEQRTETITDFQAAFERFRKDYLTVKQAAGVRALTQAPGFNIFRLLGIQRLEARTHSIMLAELLNPQGSHGQGELFLRAFLSYCHTRYPDFPYPVDEIGSSRWSVSTEMTSQFGRMDIVLLNPLLGFLGLIENKIDAYEQEHQLERYGHWLDTHRQDFPTRALIYLTPYGGAAGTAGNYGYYRLSYRQDIAKWLEGTIPQIQAPGVTEVVKQYLGTVERL